MPPCYLGSRYSGCADRICAQCGIPQFRKLATTVALLLQNTAQHINSFEICVAPTMKSSRAPLLAANTADRSSASSFFLFIPLGQGYKSPTITVGHGGLEAVDTGVPLAAVDAVSALAAVEAMTAVRAVHWMQTCTTNSAFFSFQRCESPTITIGHGELETVGTRVPLAAVDAVGALGALAAVEATTAVRAVHWMQTCTTNSASFSFQRCESPTITIGHGELETVGTRVPLAAVDAVGALGALAAVEAMTAVRAVHWMQNMHDEFCFLFFSEM